MIYILHGDDVSVSRKRATELLEEVSVTISLDGKSLSKKLLEDELVSQSLFLDTKGILVENFFLKNKQKKEISEYLNEANPQEVIVFWEGDTVRKNAIPSIKNIRIEEYKLPQNYFNFLDNLRPHNARQSHILYESLLTSYSAEQILYSLIKRIRSLLIVQSHEENLFKETKGYAPWQLKKMQSQAMAWKGENLNNFYKSLFQTEVKMKSGGLPTKLSLHLDILILSQLT